MDGDTIHKAEEFGSLPWATLDPDEFGKTWSMGCGGHGFSDRTYTVSIYHDGPGTYMRADIWEIPAVLGRAIAEVKAIARVETLEGVHKALGID